MTAFDFNDADTQRSGGSLIPDGTVAVVVATLRPGGQGDGGWLRASQNNSLNNMLDFEFTVDGGEYDRRKFWTLLSYADQSPAKLDEKPAKSCAATRATLRAMLESAFGVLPTDGSDAALAKRKPTGWQSFDGIRFCAKIGIEKGSLKDPAAGPEGERYADKNKLIVAVTPDESKYISPGAQTATAGAASAVARPAANASASAAAKPAWAD
jgi:hypothetical protein